MKWLFAFTILIFSSCDKDKSCEKCLPSPPTESNGLVYYAGPLGADGCEWCIKIDDLIYSPENLPADCQLTDLEVLVTYEKTGNFFHCGFGNANIPIIHIKSIKKI